MEALHTNYGYAEFNNSELDIYQTFNVTISGNTNIGDKQSFVDYASEITKHYNKHSFILSMTRRDFSSTDANVLDIFIYKHEDLTNPIIVRFVITPFNNIGNDTCDYYCYAYDSIDKYMTDASLPITEWKNYISYRNATVDYIDVNTMQFYIIPVYDKNHDENLSGRKPTGFVGFDALLIFKRKGTFHDNEYMFNTNRISIVESYHSYIEEQENKTDEGAEGGFGSYDDTSDNIGHTPLPDIDLTSPMSHLFSLTESQYKDFGKWIWSTDFVKQIQTFFSSPSEAILSVGLIAFNHFSSNIKEIIVGNVNTGVFANAISNWLNINCGTLNISEYYGSYIDYTPTTTMQLYLPFVGYIDIDADIFINNSVNIQYNCDLLSGKAVAEVIVTNRRNNFTCKYLSIPCLIMANVPLSLLNKSQMIASCSQLIGGTIGSIATGNPMIFAASFGSNIGDLALNSAKQTYTGISGQGDITGIMGHKKPFVIIKRGNISNPSIYNKLFGFALNMTSKVGDCSGFTKIADCHVDIARTTEEEKEEILRLLKEGIVL